MQKKHPNEEKSPHQNHVLADLIRHQANQNPDNIALLFENRETSYGVFNDHSNQIANGLIDAGLKPGECIAYLGKNSDFYFEYWVGAAKAGVVLVPVNWRLAPPEVSYIIDNCAPKFMLCDPDFLDRLDSNADYGIITTRKNHAFPDFETWRDAQSKTDPRRDADYDGAILQLYTSGTTGNPKGAILSNRSLLALRNETPIEDFPQWYHWCAKDVSLIAMPVFHISGSGWGLWTLQHGAKGIIVSELDPNQVFDLLITYEITKIMLVPTAMRIVCDHPDALKADFRFLKYICYGGSAIPIDLMRQAISVFGCGFAQMYGMTETSGTIISLPPEDHSAEGNSRMRSVGTPLPGVEVKIINAQGQEVVCGEVGEITTRSPANLKEYHNLPDATAETIDQDGWLRTGDAGHMDEDGYIFLADRIKDIIITGGENVYPAEVENALYSHPQVKDVAVIGVADPKWGEAIKAIIVPEEDDHPDPDQLIAYARKKIAAYKTPKTIAFRSSLPRNPSGKILRRVLRDEYG